MFIDRNDPEPAESSGTGGGGSLAEMVSGRNTIIVSIDMSSALRLCKFETQVRIVSAHFRAFLLSHLFTEMINNIVLNLSTLFNYFILLRQPERLLMSFLLNCVFYCHGRGPFTVKSKLNGTLLRTIYIYRKAMCVYLLV